MKEKIDFTKNILNKISKNIKKDNKKESSNCKTIISNNKFNSIEDNSYVMIPTNHKNIKEILDLLNNSHTKYKNETINHENNKDEVRKEIITLNDIMNLNEGIISISKNTIITPMAKDYIKQKKIKIEIGG
ncbi:hypothetical protein [Paraclostridium bifermentans]|uniref:hypothetical protein n=1 Tax=Paraclostridium bifermentans TaxID=1490 RepID=UPI0006B370B3|nr:hypothetical protein [Paraclostridium bifermentans]OSB12414.1 hypothetical protein B2H97_04780 [Paraclostridium bifermentans]